MQRAKDMREKKTEKVTALPATFLLMTKKKNCRAPPPHWFLLLHLTNHTLKACASKVEKNYVPRHKLECQTQNYGSIFYCNNNMDHGIHTIIQRQLE